MTDFVVSVSSDNCRCILLGLPVFSIFCVGPWLHWLAAGTSCPSSLEPIVGHVATFGRGCKFVRPMQTLHSLSRFESPVCFGLGWHAMMTRVLKGTINGRRGWSKYLCEGTERKRYLYRYSMIYQLNSGWSLPCRWKCHADTSNGNTRQNGW